MKSMLSSPSVRCPATKYPNARRPTAGCPCNPLQHLNPQSILARLPNCTLQCPAPCSARQQSILAMPKRRVPSQCPKFTTLRVSLPRPTPKSPCLPCPTAEHPCCAQCQSTPAVPNQSTPEALCSLQRPNLLLQCPTLGYPWSAQPRSLHEHVYEESKPHTGRPTTDPNGSACMCLECTVSVVAAWYHI